MQEIPHENTCKPRENETKQNDLVYLPTKDLKQEFLVGLLCLIQGSLIAHMLYLLKASNRTGCEDVFFSLCLSDREHRLFLSMRERQSWWKGPRCRKTCSTASRQQ